MGNQYIYNTYQLLEEARKSWDYFISNEIVYEGKFVNTHGAVENLSWVNSYFIGDLWFELCVYIGDKLGIAMLIEKYDNPSVIGRQDDMRKDVAWCNDPMFVGIYQKLQVSEQVKFRPIPTIVWLKPFDFTVCSRQDEFKSTATSPRVIHSRDLIVQGKLNRPGLLGSEFLTFGLPNVQHSKFPSDMVKRISEVSDNISDNKTPTLGSEGRFYIDLNQLCSALKYGLFRNGMLWIEQVGDTPFEGVDVYIRPLNLEPGAIKWLHMLKYPQGETDASKETKDTQRARDTRAHQRRVSEQSQESRQVLNSSPPGQVASQTERVHRRGGCTAKHTRSGNLEDA